MKYARIEMNLLLLIVSIFFAFLISNNSTENKERNDLLAYQAYYKCVQKNLVSCDYLIGNPSDLAFQSTVKFSVSILNISTPYIFIFIYAFIIIFMILYSLKSISPLPIVSILFVLTDFRFYEYSSNVLRVGIAVVLMLIAFKPALSKNRYFSLIPSLGHITTVPMFFTPKQKLSYLFLLSSLILILVLNTYFIEIYDFIRTFIHSKIVDKLVYYKELGSRNDDIYTMPLHYFIIYIFGFILKNKINNVTYIYAFNISWIFFLASLLAYNIHMQYRFFFLILPFISIVFAFQVEYMLKRIETIELKLIFILLLISFYSIVFFKNMLLIMHAF